MMKNNYVTKLTLLVFTLLCSVLSWGQASIATLGTPVVENFAGFSSPAAGTAVTAGNSPTNWTISTANNWQGTNQAGGTTGGWYASNNISFLGSGSASNGNATWRLRNNTGSTITSFDISFVARMWRSQANSPTVSLTYSTNSTGTVPAAGALTSILTFNDATASIATGTTLTQTVSSLSIPNGDYIYIRFLHPGGSTSDNLGWDDVSITCNGGCSSAAITTQPSTTVQNLCQSGTATALSVTATGTTVTYQWYSNVSNSNSGGTLIASATSASYTPSTAAAGTLYYYCVASASCGLPVTSNVSGAVNVASLPSAPAGTINVSVDILI